MEPCFVFGNFRPKKGIFCCTCTQIQGQCGLNIKEQGSAGAKHQVHICTALDLASEH